MKYVLHLLPAYRDSVRSNRKMTILLGFPVAQSTFDANGCLVVEAGHAKIMFRIGTTHSLGSFGHRPDWSM